MGIVNLTPDSFSADGVYADGCYDTGRAVAIAQRLMRDGADIIDIGGESTRPGAQEVPAREEIRRVIPAIRLLAKKIHRPISIDSHKPAVIKHALDAGASIVNTVKGVTPERSLLRMVQRYDAAIVLMHMRGNPQTMQKNICYRDLVGEIICALRKSIEKCLEIGIKSDRIIIDPGSGFGKTAGQNLEIISRLSEFNILACPILIGPSRKSFIGKVLRKGIGNRVMGTAAAVSIGIQRGAHIVRVHDVAAMRDVIRLTDAFLNPVRWNLQ